MLLSNIHLTKRDKYLNTTVQVQSAMVTGEAVLKAFHKSQAVVILDKKQQLGVKCKTHIQKIVLNPEHIIVV